MSQRLHVRSADPGPGPAVAEYFGRIGESVLTNRELPHAAKVVYAAIRLRMAVDGTPTYRGTVQDLGRLVGVTERYAREMVAALETYGHVVRERDRTLKGSPQVIRCTASLRGPYTRNQGSECTRNSGSGDPEPFSRGSGTTVPGPRNNSAGTLKREKDREKQEQQQEAGSAGVVAFSAPPREENTEPEAPGRSAWLRSLTGDLAAKLASLAGDDQDEVDPPGRKKRPPGSSAKTPPGAGPGSEVPDALNCTDKPQDPSTQNYPTEHKPQT